MTGRAAHLLDEQDDRVAVAVEPDGLDLLHVPGRAALVPQALAAAAVIVGLAGFKGFFPRFGVHPRQHEHVEGLGILRHGGDEASRFAEVRRKGK